MKNRNTIFLAHSAGTQSKKGEGSFDLVKYLRSELGENYEVLFPIVDEPDSPSYHHWKVLFDREFDKLKENVILIGHSLGGSMLLKYLSEEKSDLKIKGMFLVATPQWSASGWDMAEFAVQKDFTQKLPPIPVIYFYHCLNDPFVPFQHLHFYRTAFPAGIFRELHCTDHAFAGGLKELVDDIQLITND